MNLTKLRLDYQKPGVRQCLRNCHDMHRTVMSAFGDIADKQPRASEDVLYRLVPSPQGGILYLTSKNAPMLSGLEKSGFYEEGSRNLDALRGVLVEGSGWKFDLMAVPSKKIRAEGKNSRRAYLVTPEERRLWLERKGEQNGFKILFLEERGEQKCSGQRGDARIIFSAMQFGGILEVTDKEKFWHGYSGGIGPERAYGMGMLMLAGLS